MDIECTLDKYGFEKIKSNKDEEIYINDDVFLEINIDPVYFFWSIRSATPNGEELVEGDGAPNLIRTLDKILKDINRRVDMNVNEPININEGIVKIQSKEFDSKEDAKIAAQEYLINYNPSGYSTHLKIIEMPNGKWKFTGTRYDSCD